jgi:hypothetical protein
MHRRLQCPSFSSSSFLLLPTLTIYAVPEPNPGWS